MAESSSPWHLSRGWGADPFAPACGCEVAPCGHVIDGKVNPDCPQHSLGRAKTFRSAHRERFCPGAVREDAAAAGIPTASETKGTNA